MWSVVTPVPAGTHEFKFVVDSVWKHSTRHPTVGEDEETMNNIRVIRGPPKNKQHTARMSEQRNKDAGVTPAKKKNCCVVSCQDPIRPPLWRSPFAISLAHQAAEGAPSNERHGMVRVRVCVVCHIRVWCVSRPPPTFPHPSINAPCPGRVLTTRCLPLLNCCRQCCRRLSPALLAPGAQTCAT